MNPAAHEFTDNPPGYRAEAGAPPRRLYRSRSNRVFAGVCAGVAEYFGGDPTMVRLATAILAVVTGIVPMIVLYILAAIVIPERGGGAVAADSEDRQAAPGQGALVLGVILVAVGVLALANQLFRIDWELLWPFVLVVAGAALLVGSFGRRA